MTAADCSSAVNSPEDAAEYSAAVRPVYSLLGVLLAEQPSGTKMAATETRADEGSGAGACSMRSSRFCLVLGMIDAAPVTCTTSRAVALAKKGLNTSTTDRSTAARPADCPDAMVPSASSSPGQLLTTRRKRTVSTEGKGRVGCEDGQAVGWLVGTTDGCALGCPVGRVGRELGWALGRLDGRPCGCLDGWPVGWELGFRVGRETGCLEGCRVGWPVGMEGRTVGCDVGWRVGCRVGWPVGRREGWRVGCLVGWRVGCLVGCGLGRAEGCEEGRTDGCPVGWRLGCPDGRRVGSDDGWPDGCPEGQLKGWREGAREGWLDGQWEGCELGWFVG